MCSVPYFQASWYCRGKGTCRGMLIERQPLHRRTCGADYTNCLRVEYRCVKSKSALSVWMYKTSVYTLVNGNIENVAHRKQQKSQKVILSASHWLCVNVLNAICIAPSKVTQIIFAVLENWYHHIVLTHSCKLVSFFTYIFTVLLLKVGEWAWRM